MNIIETIKELIHESNKEQKIKINGLIFRTTCKVFCINRKNNTILTRLDKYQLPGGALDIGENHIKAAKRELMEESGWVATNYYEKLENMVL